MKFTTILSILSTLVVFPLAASACEGECIVGIARVYEGNMSYPVFDVMNALASEIASELVPSYTQRPNPMYYLSPLLTAYEEQAYESLRTAIFPRYFHGKCQIDGVNPPGCPNPDCPVVCGTPGSMVHHFAKLRSIVVNDTSHSLTSLSAPNTDVYHRIERAVLDDVYGDEPRRMARFIKRAPDEKHTKAKLKQIMRKIKDLLVERCEGTGKDGLTGLAACSWEGPMKRYFLTFP